MPYNANIPQPTDQLTVSQGDILANFQALEPVGNNWMLFNILGADPVTVGGQMALFSKVSTITGATELYLERPLGAAIYEISGTDGFYTRLPSGILMAWGNSVANGDQTIVVPMPVATNFISVLSVNLQARGPFPPVGGDPNRYVTLLDITNTGLGNQVNLRVYAGSRTVANSAALTPFYYFIIGT